MASWSCPKSNVSRSELEAVFREALDHLENDTVDEKSEYVVDHKSNPYTFLAECFEAKSRTLGIPWQHGYNLLKNHESNRGVAFTMPQRDALGLHGLLPAAVLTIAEQESRVLWNLERMTDDLDKYTYLANLSKSNQTLFYRVLTNNIKKMMPIVYTPTVGRACQEFAHIFSRPQGIFITIADLGKVKSVLSNWPRRDVRAIVFTDGERILGLGDLGACGMGIPIGKLALYSAVAGVPPSQTLPVTLDTGTENKRFLDDPMYIGVRNPRCRDERYDQLVLEFMTAAEQLFGPDCILQFEDFGNANAFRLLESHRHNFNTFNDDIQGTASVVLAGIYSAAHESKQPLTEQKFLFSGAGSAGLGIGELMAQAIHLDFKVPIEQTRNQMWFMDSKGLIYQNRPSGGINHEKAPFAHPVATQPTFDITDITEVVRFLKPSAIIGVSAQGGLFVDSCLRLMGEQNARPVIFPLSNPTSKAECTATAAYTLTGGRAIFASGSPFDPVVIDGKTLVPGQGNNSYIFPGLALGVMVSRTRRIPDSLFITAAKALAGLVTDEHRATGNLYPDLNHIGEASVHVAAAVAEKAYELGLANQLPKPTDMIAAVRAFQFNSKDYVAL